MQPLKWPAPDNGVKPYITRAGKYRSFRQLLPPLNALAYCEYQIAKQIAELPRRTLEKGIAIAWRVSDHPYLRSGRRRSANSMARIYVMSLDA